MKIVFVINDVETEKETNTTPLLMFKAYQRGHEVLLMDVGDFSFSYENKSSVSCRCLRKKDKPETVKDMLEMYRSNGICKQYQANDIDVLFLRNNPTEEVDRAWAEHSAIAFGRMLQKEGVLVLNDSTALSTAFIDKLYFEELPSEIKPNSLISRNADEIRAFYEKHKKNIVLKPLEGSGGQHVYRIAKDEKNLNQILETLLEKGYIIAQEFLPEVSKGDVRVILVNGKFLQEGDHTALIRRVASKDEFRSNFSLGASAKKAKVTKEIERIVELVSPKLIRDGLFMTGLDIVDDKLIEINVLSPGGLERMEEIDLPDFSTPIIEAIERKIEYKKTYGNEIPNRVLATMD